MNKKMFLLMIGVMVVSACSSNEANIKTDKAVSNEDVMAVKTEVKAMKESVMIQEKPMMDSGHNKSSKMAEPTMDNNAVSNNKISVCKSGSDIRTISVVYKHNEATTSCEVTYEKSSGVKTLWNANSDLSYCETKAAEFVKKQEGWGWSCSELE